ncbi:MAG: hypothetical protein ACREIU_08155, partial [Planctomycetota bacterium]
MNTLGSDEGLRVELAWEDSGPPATAADATRGSLRLSLRGSEVWRGVQPETGFRWTWIELLEFLAHAWPCLS